MASRFEGFPLADIRKGGQGSGGPQLAQSQLRVGWSVVVTRRLNGRRQLSGLFFAFARGPVASAFFGVWRPISGRFGVYLYLPFGLGPSPGRNDCCVKEVLGVYLVKVPTLQIIDFVVN